jgi:hypothetical protein
VIGISGAARAGKDTLFEVLDEIFETFHMTRLAFADALKEECDEFLKTNTGISAFTKDDEEKEIIRPFLVAYGSNVRRRINPNCWIEGIDRLIRESEKKTIHIITDVRYPNELDWIEQQGGLSIHVSRDGIKPANSEEAENDPILRERSRVRISIPTFEHNYFNKCKSTIQQKIPQKLITSL